MPRILRLAGTIALCIVPALAFTDWKSLKPQGYVSDFAGVIDAQSRAQLDDYASRVEQATGAQLAFVTIPSLEGEPIEDVTIDLFKAWGVGQKKKDNGAMLLLSIQDRRSRLEVGFGLGGAVPDNMSGMVLEDMRPQLRQGRYGPAMIQAAVRLGETIAKDQGVQIPPPASYQRPRRISRDSLPWPLIIFGIFLLFAFISRAGRGGFRGGGYRGGGGGDFLTGMLLGTLLNSGRHRGGRDGGGFGGFDGGGGGGGFGGFGGGSSGGGGASSGW
ncbi:MAG TPA: TPM domain-containing protein [Bryobacteraceae bacterium]|nr:TPM domain-containing protein [Bryobacteraceae bacterium]